jgi:elongator complex protein 1
VPPPMAHLELAADANIIHAAVWNEPSSSTDARVAILDHSSVWVVSINLTETTTTSQALRDASQARVPHPQMGSKEKSAAMYYQQVQFADSKHVLLLASQSEKSIIQSFEIENGQLTRQWVRQSDPVQSLLPSHGLARLLRPYLHLRSGQIIEIDKVDMFSTSHDWPEAIATFPGSVDKMDILEEERGGTHILNGNEAPGRRVVVFCLKATGRLFANERCLADNCTSFLITGAHLIFTTSQHFLKFVHIAAAEGELLMPLLVFFCC